MNLILSNTHTIQEFNGLYSLNDLHKASGNEKRHEPNRFLRNQQTQELIHEIESDNQIAYHTVQGGNTKTVKQGTYACRELVYAYAMWISAKFHLMVIRAFDRMTKGEHIPCLGKPQSNTQSTELTHAQWTALSSLVQGASRHFWFSPSANSAFWYRLRQATVVKSPQKFSREHLPIIADELERIFAISQTYLDARIKLENKLIKQVIRGGDDEAMAFFVDAIHDYATNHQKQQAINLSRVFGYDYQRLMARP